jgi:hypothetical protein
MSLGLSGLYEQNKGRQIWTQMLIGLISFNGRPPLEARRLPGPRIGGSCMCERLHLEEKAGRIRRCFLEDSN